MGGERGERNEWWVGKEEREANGWVGREEREANGGWGERRELRGGVSCVGGK